MEKDEKTTSDHVNCKENPPTSMNVERLTPDMIQACGVQGAVWMMIIDKRHQRHFWAAEGTFEDPPGSKVWWYTHCKGGLAGELPRWTTECMGRDPDYEPSQCPECGPDPYIKQPLGDICE